MAQNSCTESAKLTYNLQCGLSKCLDLHRIWCRMSLAEFLFQRLAESLLDGIDGEGNLF